jgi:hypothetical protein
MQRKPSTATLNDYFFWPFSKVNPTESWEFDVYGLQCAVVNQWRDGAKLLVNNTVVAEDKRLFSLTGWQPMMSTTVKDAFGKTHRIDVHLRAIFTVKIRVAVDGKWMYDEFM